RYKFLDPGTGNRAYWARLLVTPVGSNVAVEVDAKQFHARNRNVLHTRTADTPFEAFGKAYMWKIYGKHQEDATPVCTAPAEDDANLFFGPNDNTVKTAYDCVTPRGAFRSVAHGLIDGGAIKLDGTVYNGFAGPASGQGTKSGTSPIYDVSGHAEMHNVSRYLLSCYGTSVQAGYSWSVAESLKNSLSGTIGGGASVTGYPGVCLIWPGMLSWQFGGSLDADDELTMSEQSEMMAFTNKAIRDELVQIGVFGWFDDQTQQETDNPDDNDARTLKPHWIHARTFQTIDDITGCNLTTISQNAKKGFMDAHPGHDDFTWSLTSLTFSYDISGAHVIGTTAIVSIPGTN
ncbi:MAG: hypothetical protein U1E05_18585, partial [Patescibacteria group bacterium]|nr:hypothetical protein [Patescibacteria group bacterium]